MDSLSQLGKYGTCVRSRGEVGFESDDREPHANGEVLGGSCGPVRAAFMAALDFSS